MKRTSRLHPEMRNWVSTFPTFPARAGQHACGSLSRDTRASELCAEDGESGLPVSNCFLFTCYLRKARVWRKSYKVYKESVFLYNNKKPKATRAVVYTKHGDIASLANRFLTRRGDKTERGARDGVKAGERAACKKEGKVGRGSSPSINLQAGA